jgi:membrane-bound serine protease (ClpP class)
MGSILPVNITGLLLIGLAVALFVIDVFASTHGVLTVGGAVAFLVGSLMLFDRHDPAFRLPLAYIIPATLLTALFFVFVAGKGVRAQFLPARTGPQTMLGRTTDAVTAIDAHGGRVFLEGEYWNAVSEAPVRKGSPVEITAINGLTLTVKPVS